MRIRKVEEFEIKGLGKILKDRRIELGLSVVTIADLAGISPIYYYKLEQGARESVPYETYKKICKVLKLDLGLTAEKKIPAIA